MHRTSTRYDASPGCRIILVAFLVSLCGQLSGCSTGPHLRPAPLVNHPVFFTLNDPADAAELVADCDALLPGIPGVTAYYCGTPLDTGRDAVDLNFDVGVYIGFDSVEAYDRYLVHPKHEQLIARWTDRIASIRIHDIVDEEN